VDKPNLMMTNEPVIHLKDGEEFLCDVRTTQDDLDALNALINWLDGYSAGSSDGVPGHYELTVFYRTLRANHNAKHGKIVRRSK
jgi:hypothetical protein